MPWAMGGRSWPRRAAEQMRRLEYYASFGDLSNEPAIRLAQRLAGLAPAHLNTVHFTNGGSEGTETALKLARLAHHNVGQPERTAVLMRQDGYHGSSNVSMAMSGIARLKQGFGPALPGFIQLSPPRAKTPAEVEQRWKRWSTPSRRSAPIESRPSSASRCRGWV